MYIVISEEMFVVENRERDQKRITNMTNPNFNAEA